MIETLFTQPNYVASKKMLDATVLRHEAIASNLANLETPNYKRLDISGSFQTELQQAFARQNADEISELRPTLQVDPSAVAQRADGNTVQLESELTELQKNLLEHSVGTQLITGALLRLRLAITGRPT
jgi:flagellar basal-body rod protein FlgB